MSIFEIILLAVTAATVLYFAIVHVAYRITKPIEKRDGKSYITNKAKYDKWSRSAETASKVLLPVLIIGGSTLALWVVIRVVVSFI